MAETLGDLREAREVYDNPNYSHIMIGGQPFFILPSGELSDHVPVPGAAEAVPVTPGLQAQTRHTYEPGSYRETSDYDTDSSTYRPDSDRASVSAGPAPIYEEIDRDLELRLRGLSPALSAPGSASQRPPPGSGTRPPVSLCLPHPGISRDICDPDHQVTLSPLSQMSAPAHYQWTQHYTSSPLTPS